MSSKRRGNRNVALKASKEVVGMPLAMAYAKLKSYELRLRITKFDDELRILELGDADDSRVNVDVLQGIIKRAWVG